MSIVIDISYFCNIYTIIISLHLCHNDDAIIRYRSNVIVIKISLLYKSAKTIGTEIISTLIPYECFLQPVIPFYDIPQLTFYTFAIFICLIFSSVREIKLYRIIMGEILLLKL